MNIKIKRTVKQQIVTSDYKKSDDKSVETGHKSVKKIAVVYGA